MHKGIFIDKGGLFLVCFFFFLLPFTAWGFQVPNFQFHLTTLYPYLGSFPFLVFKLCTKDCRSHLKVRIKEKTVSKTGIFLTSQLSLLKYIYTTKTSPWMRALLFFKKKPLKKSKPSPKPTHTNQNNFFQQVQHSLHFVTSPKKSVLWSPVWISPFCQPE